MLPLTFETIFPTESHQGFNFGSKKKAFKVLFFQIEVMSGQCQYNMAD